MNKQIMFIFNENKERKIKKELTEFSVLLLIFFRYTEIGLEITTEILIIWSRNIERQGCFACY